MLGSSIVDCIFYDVFAGTGVVGVEALSRGAARAVFIELDRHQVALIRRNLDRAHFGPEASVRGADAFRWANHFLPEATPSIIFLGPPYPLFRSERERLLEMVQALIGKLKNEDILVLQFPRFIHPESLPNAESWHRIRTYGKTSIGIWLAQSTDQHVDDERLNEPQPSGT